MPTMGQRMFKMKKLLDIRLGPGAAILPREVQKIAMRFAPRIEDGHRGPRKFVGKMLPRLQYHNPALRITVDRSAAQTDPAVLDVCFSSPSPSSSQTQTPALGDRVVTIYMKGKTENEILDQLLDVTKAQPVEATEVEKEELRELAAHQERSVKDSERQAEVNRKLKREKEMLAMARGEIRLNDV